MTSKSQVKMHRLREALSENSWTNYRRLVGRLCQDYSHLDFVRPISGFIRNEDVRGLVDYADSLSKQQYGDATTHFVANQFAYLIKKYPFPSGLNPFKPDQEAWAKFQSSEDKCRLVNEYFDKEFLTDSSVQWHFQEMRSFISYVIGLEPCLTEIYEVCDFGPGASVGVHGNATNLARKLASDWSVSPSALHYARSAVYTNFHFLEALAAPHCNGIMCIDVEKLNSFFAERIDIVRHNKIAFVPKTVRTNRSIAVEPLLNGYVQKGVDNVLRKRLRRIGIDLSVQARNQEFAYLGSLSDCDESFVTIDLSAASDSVSIGLCRELLPPEWFSLLDHLRSVEYSYGGAIKRYHKFCSMGNGFCFPLETLLFSAACKATGCGKPGTDFLVYGDDIICRRKHAKELIALLERMGFAVNTDKTFIEGPFRESCGRDWFEGKDVRPFVLDFALDSLSAIFKFLNLSRRSSATSQFFEGVREFLYSLIPDNYLFKRPFPGPADTAITVDKDEFMTSPFAWWNKNYQAWEWKELITFPLPDEGWEREVNAVQALTMAALSGASSSEPFTLRRKTRTAVKRRGEVDNSRELPELFDRLRITLPYNTKACDLFLTRDYFMCESGKT